MNDMRKCPTCGAMCNVVGEQEFEGSAVMSVLLVPACDALVEELADTDMERAAYDEYVRFIVAKYVRRAKKIMEASQ